MLADEVGAPGQRLLAEPEDARVIDRTAVGERVIHRPGVPAGGDLGDLGLDPHQVALGPYEHAVGRSLGVEGVPEPTGVQLRAEPRVAICGRQRRLQPGQVVVHGLQRRNLRRLDLRPQPRLLGQRGADLRLDQLPGPGELHQRGLDVHPGHPAEL